MSEAAGAQQTDKCHADAGALKNLPTEYAVERLDSLCLAELRRALASEQFIPALNIYYRGQRAENLLNWVVYIDSSGGIKQGLVKGHRDEVKVDRGNRYVWVLVFSERRPKRDGEKVTFAGFRLSRRTVEYRREPALAALVGTLGSIVGGSIAAPPIIARADSTLVLTPELVGHQPGDTLFVVSARFGLAEDAETSLGVSLDTGAFYPESTSNKPSTFRSAHRSIVNASPSLAEVSVAVGGTYARRTAIFEDGIPTGHIKGVRPGLFLSLVFNIFKRPTFPRKPFSSGVGLATNFAPGGLLDDLIVGWNLARFGGVPFGVTLGVSWSKRPEGSTQERDSRVLRPALLVELRL